MTWKRVPNGKRGRQQTYSDTSIQTCLTMKALFGMILRQTTGFVESLPDFSALSRRQRPLMGNIPYRGTGGPLQDRESPGARPGSENDTGEQNAPQLYFLL